MARRDWGDRCDGPQRHLKELGHEPLDMETLMRTKLKNALCALKFSTHLKLEIPQRLLVEVEVGKKGSVIEFNILHAGAAGRFVV